MSIDHDAPQRLLQHTSTRSLTWRHPVRKQLVRRWEAHSLTKTARESNQQQQPQHWCHQRRQDRKQRSPQDTDAVHGLPNQTNHNANTSATTATFYQNTSTSTGTSTGTSTQHQSCITRLLKEVGGYEHVQQRNTHLSPNTQTNSSSNCC
jgi:hypothetical protein